MRKSGDLVCGKTIFFEVMIEKFWQEILFKEVKLFVGVSLQSISGFWSITLAIV